MERFLEPQISADGPQMSADLDRTRINAVTHAIIGAAQKVSAKLGQGFLERVYKNALGLELRKLGLAVEHQKSISVRYDNVVVGDYVADLMGADEVIVEIKVVDCLSRPHRLQCINYLRATGLRVGLLLNFGPRRLEVRRLVSRF
jgi:GxxExxY protein